MTAGFIEIRVARWPIKGGCRGKYAGDVGPSTGIYVGPFFHVLTLSLALVGTIAMFSKPHADRGVLLKTREKVAGDTILESMEPHPGRIPALMREDERGRRSLSWSVSTVVGVLLHSRDDKYQSPN